jgi:putative DNA primase/helicase
MPRESWMKVFQLIGGKRNLSDETATKPLTLEVNASGIPQELKALAQWVCWKLKRGEKRWEKIPIDPKTGRYGSATNPSTWGTFDQAWEHYRSRKGGGIDGLGFVFTEDDPYAGIDLDKCRDPETGEIAPWALEIVTRMNSFTELSPSGTGLHIFVEGKLPGKGINTQRVEIYDRGRYFTVTGHTL